MMMIMMVTMMVVVYVKFGLNLIGCTKEGVCVCVCVCALVRVWTYGTCGCFQSIFALFSVHYYYYYYYYRKARLFCVFTCIY